MEPVYIYFDQLTFNDKNRVILKFSKNDEIKKAPFSSKKEYFITSMKCFLKLDSDIKNWKKYKKYTK